MKEFLTYFWHKIESVAWHEKSINNFVVVVVTAGLFHESHFTIGPLFTAHLHIATKKPSSKFHRRFIEFFVAMHEFFDEIYLSHFFQKLKLI